jgi:hypothetical protein
VALVFGGLTLVLLAAHGRAIFGGETFVLHDHLIYTLPSRAHLVDALAHGRLAEWWGAIGLGAPFAANPNHGALYPPAWLAACFSPSVGADAVVLLHLLWLGLGGAMLAARLSAGRTGAMLAGGMLMTSGFATSIAVNALPPITFAWTPWLAWAACGLATAPERRSRWRAAAVLGLCAAMQLVSGEPAGIITSLLLSAFLTLVLAQRRVLALGRFAAAIGFALLLSAFALLPAVGLLLETNRAGGLALADAGAWSLHPFRLVELFWPRVLGSPGDPALHLARAVADSGGARGLDPSWALSFYTGAPTLLFAFLAVRGRVPHARALALGSLALLVLALGTYTPVYQLFRAVFLPEKLVRYPERHFAGTLVLWTTLAGLGFGRLLSSEARDRWAGRAFAVAAAGMGAAVLVVLVLSKRVAAAISVAGQVLVPRLDGAGIASMLSEGGVLAVSVLAATWLCLSLRARDRERLAAAGAAIVILAGLVVEAWWLHPMLPRAAIDQRPALLAPVPEGHTPRPRLYRHPGLRPELSETGASLVALGLHHTVCENLGARFGVDHFPGWDPAQPARLVTFWAAAVRSGGGQRALELFGVDYAILHASEVGGPLQPMAATPKGDVVIVRNNLLRPRAFVAPRWRTLGSDAEMLDALFMPSFDRGEVRLAGPPLAPAPTGGAEPGAQIVPCTVESSRPERVRLDCRAPFAGYAVLLDAFWPGWLASVDGRPVAIERADLMVRAVPLPAGAHRIEMVYETPGLRAGAWLSLPAWLVLVSVFVRTRRRAPRAA